MSWDVVVFNFGGVAPPRLEEIDESKMLPLGTAADVRRQISDLLAGVDWSDPTWGVYGENGFSIEFNVGEADPLSHIMLHVRGGGDAIAAIARFARPLGWCALDCSTSEFLDFENPSQAGWQGFQAYRDKIIKRSRNETDQSG